MQTTMKSMGVLGFSKKIERLKRNWVTKTVILMMFSLPNFAYANFSSPFSNISPIFAPKLRPIYVNPNALLRYDKFLTFTPDVKVIGPIFGEGSLQYYYELIFRHIIQQADLKIHNEPAWGYQAGSNKNFSYYAFLVLALAIVQHESSGVHFRQMAGDKCDSRANALRDIWPNDRWVLAPIYRDPLSPLIPDCRYVKNPSGADQILLDAPTGDLGIMQMNARYHPAAMDPTVLMNVYRSIDAGMNVMWTGFEMLRDQLMSPSLRCIRPTDPFRTKFSKDSGLSKPAIWANLDVEAWSHSYNGQPLCDVSPSNVRFYDDLMSIVRDNSSIWHRYLPKGSLERAALDEIVANFRAAFSKRLVSEHNSALKKILSSSGTPYKPWLMPKRTLIAPTDSLRRGKISVYYAPLIWPQFACGYLSSGGNGVERVRAINTNIDVSGHKLAEIELPAFVSFAHIARQMKLLELRKGILGSPIRRAIPESQVSYASTYIRMVQRNALGRSPIFSWVETKTDSKGRKWDVMIDSSGVVVYGYARNFQIVDSKTKDLAANACAQSKFFVRMADLKRLRPIYHEGQRYHAVVVGKGQLPLMSLPRADSTVVDYKGPGARVRVVDVTVNGLGEQWYKLRADQPGFIYLWAPQSRIQLLSEIKGGSGP